MSMKVVFLKDYMEYKAGFEGFIPRTLGSRLCDQKVTVPWCMKDRISPAEKAAITKAKNLAEKEAKRKAKEEKKAKAERKAKAEKAKADKLKEASLKPKAENAFSKKFNYK